MIIELIMADSDASKPEQRTIATIKATKLVPIIAKTSSDERTCAIWGMALTADGSLFFTDAMNLKIKMFAKDGKLISFQKFTNGLASVAMINNSRAVVCTHTFQDGDTDEHEVSDGDNDDEWIDLGVSAYEHDELQFLDISNPSSMSVQRNISVDFSTTGLTVFNDHLVLGAYKLIGEGPECVKMVDLNGFEIWSSEHDDNGEDIFGRVDSVVIIMFNGNAAVLASDVFKNALVVLDAATGKHLKTVEVEDKFPQGLTTDKEGNIYVCYWSTNEICVWTPDLEDSRILLTGSDLLSSPKTILYDEVQDDLYVSYSDDSDFVDRFHLE